MVVGDLVKVDRSIHEDLALGSRGLESRHGYIEEMHSVDGVLSAALVAFHDFKVSIPVKYLKTMSKESK
jgi:hypothetical protein